MVGGFIVPLWIFAKHLDTVPRARTDAQIAGDGSTHRADYGGHGFVQDSCGAGSYSRGDI